MGKETSEIHVIALMVLLLCQSEQEKELVDGIIQLCGVLCVLYKASNQYFIKWQALAFSTVIILKISAYYIVEYLFEC